MSLTKEQQRLKNQKYNAENREKISLRKKRWAKENPEKVNKHKRDNPRYHGEYMKMYRRKHPNKFAAYARKQNYGITQDWFDSKIEEQNGKCAICFCHLLNPKVDHNHDKKTVRGLLCHSCNVMIGFAHEDVVRLAGAIKYLEKYKE